MAEDCDGMVMVTGWVLQIGDGGKEKGQQLELWYDASGGFVGYEGS
jgi:hypothetical protein